MPVMLVFGQCDMIVDKSCLCKWTVHMSCVCTVFAHFVELSVIRL